MVQRKIKNCSQSNQRKLKNFFKEHKIKLEWKNISFTKIGGFNVNKMSASSRFRILTQSQLKNQKKKNFK